MSATVITGIGELLTMDPHVGEGRVGRLTNAFLAIENGVVTAVGTGAPPSADHHIDANGRAVLPAFVDAHSHLVFAGDRSAEFAARMSGTSYHAGGIRHTVEATRRASDEELRAQVRNLVGEMHRSGTGHVEIKSGYGLTVADEARSLRIAREFTDHTTFLGAHVVPHEFEGRADDYVHLVTTDMLEACAPYARWIDVFCDHGAFTVEQAREILLAGKRKGLGLRIHAQQLRTSAAVAMAVELGATSADHLTHLTATDIDLLAESQTVATLVPGAEFSTRSVYAPARALLDAGATVALATDCNPGSSYTSSMPFIIALAVRDLHMSVDEALWSATAGGAASLAEPTLGRLTPGLPASAIMLNAPSATYLAYRPGVDLISHVFTDPTRMYS